MKALKLIYIGLGLITALLLYPSATAACSPPLNSTPEPREQLVRRSYAEAVAVFVGTVISKTTESYHGQNSASGGLRVSVLFAVINTLKGTPQETVVVKTGTGWGDCGYGESFVQGATYLIYAYAHEHEANTLWLWRVVPASEAQQDIAILQQPSSVGEDVGMPRAGESQHPFLAAVVIVTGLALGAGLVMRRRA